MVIPTILRSIWSSNFFDHCTNDKEIDRYNKQLKENVFLAIELGRMSYVDIMRMPVKRLEEYIDWKIKFDTDKEKRKSEELEGLRL